MPEQATVETPKRVKLPSIDVTRNDITRTFSDAVVQRGKNNKGKGYLKTEVTEDNLDSAIGWIGRKITAALIDATLRQRSQGWYFEACEEATDKDSGQINQERLTAAFTKLACDFSARGESIPTLKKQIDELTDEMVNLDLSDPEAKNKFMQIASDIKELQLAISLKRRKDDDDDSK